MADYGMVMRFRVEIDGFGSLGTWAKCEGLQVEYDIHEYKEGGQNAFIHRIPTRAKYQNLKLTRPMDLDSRQVTGWLASNQTSVKRHTAKVTLLDSDDNPVANWSFARAWPLRWAGPVLDVGGNQVASETLELAHEGFLGNP